MRQHRSTQPGGRTAALRDILASLVCVREALADGDLDLAEAAAETAELELVAVVTALEEAACRAA